MLIPRFTIRRILAVTAAFGLVFLFLSLGVRGHVWAAAICIALFGLALVFLVHAMFFFVAWILASASGGSQPQVFSRPVKPDGPPPLEATAAAPVE